MDKEKNKKDFHVIFYLTSPQRGQFQSDDQCTDHLQGQKSHQRKEKSESIAFTFLNALKTGTLCRKG